VKAPNLSGLNPGIALIWDMFEEASNALSIKEQALLLVASIGEINDLALARFARMSEAEIKVFFKKSKDELSAMTIMNLLSAAEGCIRVDFERRAQSETETDPVSVAFQCIARYCIKNRNSPQLGIKDILMIYLENDPSIKDKLENFEKYWPYRNWLCHGRWAALPFKDEPLPEPQEFMVAITSLLDALDFRGSMNG